MAAAIAALRVQQEAETSELRLGLSLLWMPMRRSPILTSASDQNLNHDHANQPGLAVACGAYSCDVHDLSCREDAFWYVFGQQLALTDSVFYHVPAACLGDKGLGRSSERLSQMTSS